MRPLGCRTSPSSFDGQAVSRHHKWNIQRRDTAMRPFPETEGHTVQLLAAVQRDDRSPSDTSSLPALTVTYPRISSQCQEGKCVSYMNQLARLLNLHGCRRPSICPVFCLCCWWYLPPPHPRWWHPSRLRCRRWHHSRSRCLWWRRHSPPHRHREWYPNTVLSG